MNIFARLLKRLRGCNAPKARPLSDKLRSSALDGAWERSKIQLETFSTVTKDGHPDTFIGIDPAHPDARTFIKIEDAIKQIRKKRVVKQIRKKRAVKKAGLKPEPKSKTKPTKKPAKSKRKTQPAPKALQRKD